MFRRSKKLTTAQIDLLIQMVDNELSNSLESIGEFGNVDVRRVMRDYIEALSAIRTKLLSLK